MRLRPCVTTLLFAWALVSRGAAPVAAQQDDLDPVKADPAHHKVEFENAQVRVVRYRIAPGEITANHRNPSFVNIPLTDINAKFTTPDGKSTEVHLKAGTTAWRTPTTHVVQNIGDKPIEGIMVVPKEPSSALPADGNTTSVVGKAGEVRWQPATQHVVQNTGDKPLDGPIVRIAELEIDPGQLEAYKLALKEEIETSIRVEPGVLTLYAVSVKEHPEQIRLFETYRDEAAYESHLRSPHFKAYKDRTRQMVKLLRLVETEPILLGSKSK